MRVDDSALRSDLLYRAFHEALVVALAENGMARDFD